MDICATKAFALLLCVYVLEVGTANTRLREAVEEFHMFIIAGSHLCGT